MNAPLQKRERGVAQYDHEYFHKQFEGLPPRAQAIIALRAAMRVLPVLTYRKSRAAEPFAYWKAGEPARLALGIIHSCQAAAFVNSSTKADSFIADGRYATYPATLAAYYAARAATAPKGVAHPINLNAATLATFACDAAVDASRSAPLAVAAISADVEQIMACTGSAEADLLSSPLRPDAAQLQLLWRDSKAICKASMPGLKCGLSGIRTVWTASPSIGRSSGNGRRFPRSSFRKAPLKSTLI